MKKSYKLLLMVCIAWTMVCSYTYVENNKVNAAVNKVEISRKELTLRLGQQKKLLLDGNNKAVIWESSNPKIVRVSKYGVVKSRRIGSATVTAKVGDEVYHCEVTVKKPIIIMEEYFHGSYSALYSDGFSIEAYVGDMKIEKEYQNFFVWASYDQIVGAVYEVPLWKAVVKGYDTTTKKHSKMIPFSTYSFSWSKFQKDYYSNMDFTTNLTEYTKYYNSAEGYCVFKKNRAIDALKYDDGVHKLTMYL